MKHYGGRKRATTRRTKHKHTKTCKHARRGAKKSGHKKRKQTHRGRKMLGGNILKKISGGIGTAFNTITSDKQGPQAQQIGSSFGNVGHPCKTNPSLC